MSFESILSNESQIKEAEMSILNGGQAESFLEEMALL